MKLNVELNPRGLESLFHKNLNSAFPGWGDLAKYEWTYQRSVGKLSSDTMIIKDDQETILAGSGVTYRTLKTSSNEILNIGIMTGSWTLPIARRKGCFTRIIELSEELTFNKKADYLCGFLAGQNPSFGRLNAVSRYMKPTAYMFSPSQPYTDGNYKIIKLLQKGNKELYRNIFEKNIESVKNKTHFLYSLQEFKEQYIERPGNIDILQFADGNYSIIEETSDVIKVQLITSENKNQLLENIKHLVNWSLAERQKKVFYFSSLDDVIQDCANLDFEVINGYFHIIITDKSKKEKLDEDISKIFNNYDASNADKM